MKRRELLISAATIAVAADAVAGAIDWINGVKLGSRLPEYDAQFLGRAPMAGAKATLIDFWATWCAPCREEIPHLNRLSQRFAPQGLSVIGLTQEPVQVAQDFLGRVTIDYPVGAAGERPLQKQLGIKALPYAVLITEANIISWRGQASSLTDEQVLKALSGAGQSGR